MLGWDTVKKFTMDSPPTYALGRLKEVEERYTRHRDQINSNPFYTSIADYIIKDVLKDSAFVFTENEFPYKVAEGINHYLLWVSKKNSGKYDIDTLIKSQKQIKVCKEFTYYRNFKNNASGSKCFSNFFCWG